jgi:hypothetical protein
MESILKNRANSVHYTGSPVAEMVGEETVPVVPSESIVAAPVAVPLEAASPSEVGAIAENVAKRLNVAATNVAAKTDSLWPEESMWVANLTSLSIADLVTLSKDMHVVMSLYKQYDSTLKTITGANNANTRNRAWAATFGAMEAGLFNRLKNAGFKRIEHMAQVGNEFEKNDIKIVEEIKRILAEKRGRILEEVAKSKRNRATEEALVELQPGPNVANVANVTIDKKVEEQEPEIGSLFNMNNTRVNRVSVPSIKAKMNAAKAALKKKVEEKEPEIGSLFNMNNTRVNRVSVPATSNKKNNASRIANEKRFAELIREEESERQAKKAANNAAKQANEKRFAELIREEESERQAKKAANNAAAREEAARAEIEKRRTSLVASLKEKFAANNVARKKAANNTARKANEDRMAQLIEKERVERELREKKAEDEASRLVAEEMARFEAEEKKAANNAAKKRASNAASKNIVVEDITEEPSGPVLTMQPADIPKPNVKEVAKNNIKGSLNNALLRCLQQNYRSNLVRRNQLNPRV